MLRTQGLLNQLATYPPKLHWGFKACVQYVAPKCNPQFNCFFLLQILSVQSHFNDKQWMWNKKSRLFTEPGLEFCLWFRDTAVPQEQSWDKFTSPLGNPEHSMMGNPKTYVV